MCMDNYVQPTLREIHTHMILHVVTNDVPTKIDPDQISKNIVNVAIKLKRNYDASISVITARSDQYQRKAPDVNRKLGEKCREKKFSVIRHGNTIMVRLQSFKDFKYFKSSP